MWLDICTVNQVEQQQLPKDYFYSTFKEGIQQIGHTILVLQPWTDPIPLKRSWCLWEIHSTSTTGATLQVAMGASERADFQKAHIQKTKRFLNSAVKSMGLPRFPEQENA